MYGIRPENLIYEKEKRFAGLDDFSFSFRCNIVEKLGDIVNVHGTLGKDEVIVKMNSKYDVEGAGSVRVAVDIEGARFFNESTTNAITSEHNAYEEADVAVNPDEERVVIVQPEKKGFLSSIIEAIKNKFKK